MSLDLMQQNYMPKTHLFTKEMVLSQTVDTTGLRLSCNWIFTNKKRGEIKINKQISKVCSL